MSSNTSAISVRGLGKEYMIAHNAAAPTTLKEAIVERIRHPFADRRRAQESFWALKGVNFEIKRGEIVGIIGRNGAGKSTLLKLLAQITGPTTGSIDIHGRVSSLLEVGTGFHPELTGRENIFLNGSILGMPRREISRKFDEIVAFAEIERFLDTPVKRYSSGMYIRLAFAVAAHLDPDILILDEVLAVGDTAFQRKCLGKVRDVACSGERVVLFVSHNLTTVRSLCERVIWMKDGLVNYDGPSGPAIEEYLTEDLQGGSNSFDIENVQRTHLPDTPVRIRHVSLNGGDPVRHGLPLTIEIRYLARQNAEGVAFGVLFSNQEGGRVMCIDSDIPDGNRFDFAHGEGRVVFSIPELMLQPSRYSIGVTARSGENHGLDYLPMFAQIEVLEGPKTPAVLVARNEAGCVRIPSTSTHTHDAFPNDGRVSSPDINGVAVG